jgi:hypothetical protein
MNKLWVFGCSISDLYDSETSLYYWSADYLKWKGHTPKHHTQIIADTLGYELVNCAVSATCNAQIFQDFCDKIEEIGKEDQVIIQWTEPNRVRFVNDENEWMTFAFHSKWAKFKLNKFTHLSFETVQEVLVNRLDKQYRNEITSWEKLIKLKTNPDRLLIWYPFDKIIGNGKVVKSIETIRMETNNEIDDLHFSESGQIHMADILLNMLNNTTKNII